MTTRRESLFNSKKGSLNTDMVRTAINFKLNKKKGGLDPLTAEEKMVCALRLVLAVMSDDDAGGCRYFIQGDKMQITQRPKTTEGKKGEPQSYHARGVCKIQVAHPEGHCSSKLIEFSISYRDKKDSMGLMGVEYFDPTVIDVIPKTMAPGFI